jgi:hypothetical protein
VNAPSRDVDFTDTVKICGAKAEAAIPFEIEHWHISWLMSTILTSGK